MKKIILLSMVIASLFISSCDDSNKEFAKYEYHSHIIYPNLQDKRINDSMEIQVHFESHTGETIHNVNVKIYELESEKEVYNMPKQPNVNNNSGSYTFKDKIKISSRSGFESNRNYVLEAKVWGDSPGLEEEMVKMEFYVPPM